MLGTRLAQRTIRALVDKPECAKLPNRAFLSVTGVNSTQFLNGILSNLLPPEGGIFSSFLHAQGRVLYDAFVYPYKRESEKESGYLVEYDSRPSAAPPLLDMLKRYVLRSKVRIRDVSNEWNVWTAWGNPAVEPGPERCWHWAASHSIESKWKGTHSPWVTPSPFSIHDRRMVGMGLREIVRDGDKSSFAPEYDDVSSDRYLLHRIRHGVPEGVQEIVPMQAFPMESNLDLMGAVDFRKGCYVGQELTVRTFHTGLVRKRTMPVQLNPSGGSAPTEFEVESSVPEIPSGTNITAVPNASATEPDRPLRFRGNGKLLTSFQGLGLALLRSEHVEAACQGHADLQLEIGEGERTKLDVLPWWPEPWPAPPEVVEEEASHSA